MSELEEVEQDIQALEREIQSLKKQIIKAKADDSSNELSIPEGYKHYISENISFLKLPHAIDGSGHSAMFSQNRPSTSKNSVSYAIDSSIRAHFESDSISRPIQVTAGFNSLDEFINFENCLRMLGVSFFPIDYREVKYMGIRLELFDELKSKFQTPFYIILRPSTKLPELLELFRHNLPKYVNIFEHWENITMHGSNTTDVVIRRFADMCYQDLLKVHQRVQFFLKLEKVSPTVLRDNKLSLLSIDDLGNSVSFRWNDMVVKLDIDDKDEVTNCKIDDKVSFLLTGSVYDILNTLDSTK